MKNKFLTKMAAITLGLAMAVGVGVGVANNRNVTRLEATESPVTYGPVTFSADLPTDGHWTGSGGGSYCGGYGKNKSNAWSVTLDFDTATGINWATVDFDSTVSLATSVKAAGNSASGDVVLSVNNTASQSNTHSITSDFGNGSNSASAREVSMDIDSVSSAFSEITINFPAKSFITQFSCELTFTQKSGGDPVPVTYSITYDKNTTDTVTGMPSNQSGLEAGTYNLDDQATPVRTGFSFGGWAATNESTTPITSVTITDANITVYAIWTENTVSGSFNLFSGALVEGDYVISYDNKAVNTTISGDRLQYAEISPAENSVSNPAVSIVWHIAQSGDYWTLYNATVEKYAGSTSAKNQATLLDSVTDNAKWTVTGDSTYRFENLARSSGTDPNNKWLKLNGTYGFACYASGTGDSLTLYKKYIAYTISYNNNGGDGTMSNSETTVSTCTFTAPSGKEFDHWNTAPDNSGQSYNAGESVTASCTLYAIWRDLIPSVSLDKNEVSLSIGGSSVTVTATTTNITNPTFSWARSSGDDCVSLTNANTNIVTIAVANETTRVSSCIVRLTVNGTLGGNAITPITQDVDVAISRTSSSGNPFTVAEARDAIDMLGTINNAYVSGKISQIDSYSDQYHSITYWISDDGTTTNHLQVYSGKGEGGANFSAQTDLDTGASVVVTGTLKLYNSTYEFDKNSQLVSYLPLTKYTVSFVTNGGSAVESQLVVDGQTASEPSPAPTKASDENYNYTFAGWYDNAELDGDPYDFDTPVTGNLTLYAKWNSTPLSARQVIENKQTSSRLAYHYSKTEGPVEDTLNKTLTGISGSGYQNWSGKTDESNAVYAGNSLGSPDYIQLKSSDSVSGIVTTSSGGLAKKVTVSWNGGTTDGRTLDVYGKNSAYTSAANLYGDSKGTKLGAITKGTTTELTITGDYSYIGLRSNSGAMYIDSITIEWTASSYSYSNVSIRFGGVVSEELWNRLDTNEHNISGFGVMITACDQEETPTYSIKDHLDNAVLAENTPDINTKIVNHYMEIGDGVGQMEVPPVNVDTDYYWNLFFNVDSSDFNKLFTAVAYVKVGDEYVFMNQVRYSVKSLASDYITNRGTSADTHEGSLANLAA